MRHIPISKFRAACISVIENVRKTRQPVLVTRYGKPVARIVPVSQQPRRQRRILGLGTGQGRIFGDIAHANPWLDAE